MDKNPSAEGDNPQVRATSAIMGDIDSGAILFTQDSEIRLPPASLTKVMTLYLAYQALANGQLHLEDQLMVSERAWRTGGSKTFVRVGDKVRVENLILGIAVQSGNDACVVIAEHLAGSEAGFTDLMNKKAKELGMNHTHFINASGLPDPDHYTTAHDLFILARSLLLHYPQYAHYSREKQYTFNGIQQYNRNRLLWRDPSITGLKTGHTNDAQYCLIATNDLEGQRLGVVLLGSPSSKVREDESLRLFRYGARMFETVRLFESGSIIRKLRVWKGERDQVEATIKLPLVVTVPRKERSTLEVGLLYPDQLVAPINVGDEIASLVVKLGNTEIMRHPVQAAQAVPAGGLFRAMVDTIRLKLGW